MSTTATRDMTVEEFYDKHGACLEGRKWALENCSSMQDAWGKLKPVWLLWVATRPGVLTDKELRLFAVHCARSVEHLMTDQRSKDAIAVAERHANGEATDDELAAARSAASDAARSAVDYAAWSAAWSVVAAKSAASDAAKSAASDAARSAVNHAAWSAAWSATSDAASDAAWSAARSATSDRFCKYLRGTASPCFEVKS